MKTALVLLSISTAMQLLYTAFEHFELRGTERVLDAIQNLRNGTSKEEVRALMGRDPSIYPARSLPEWLKKVAPEKETGEYWYFFMGYPPRNLIIYFGDDAKVVFATWAPT